MTQHDPIALLLRLRSEMVRFASEVEMMADYRKIGERKSMADRIGRRMRDAAMSSDMVHACKRVVEHDRRVLVNRLLKKDAGVIEV